MKHTCHNKIMITIRMCSINLTMPPILSIKSEIKQIKEASINFY